MKSAKAVVFDIDGTLSPELSWTFLTKSMGASVDGHLQIYQSYKSCELDYKESKKQLIDLWNSTGNSNYDYMKAIFDSIALHNNAKLIIDSILKSYDICLITGSIDIYAKSIADRLGISNYYSNTTLIWQDCKLIDMDYHLDQAELKKEQFIDYCLRNNFDPNECIVVGDSENDLGLFDLSKRGVLIGSSDNKALKTKSWKSVTELSELLSILNISNDQN